MSNSSVPFYLPNSEGVDFVFKPWTNRCLSVVVYLRLARPPRRPSSCSPTTSLRQATTIPRPTLSHHHQPSIESSFHRLAVVTVLANVAQFVERAQRGRRPPDAILATTIAN
ncbi:hypothetical protein BIW11_02455 [Tropilaelaps mercedesae]|uniref:Uncharacterized protein n=1 Tax=Tropilaelaps mercedesae TaxID=418985 RepID=A0A1V9Y2T1_9ACAR|nr:hypothetical protein BIW11_02455 [Tropilaelaps mercedesae]